MVKNILLYILLTILAIPSYSGPWNKAKKKGYFQVGFTTITYDQIINGIDKRFDLKRSISDHTIQFYTEYGLSDKLNLIVNLPYKIVGSSDNLNDVDNDPYINDTLESGKLSGLSSVELGLRYVIFQKKYILTVQIMLGNNMHKYQQNTGLRVGYDAYQITPLMLLGRSWTNQYIQLGVGAEIKTGNYAQNFIGMFEAGQKLFNEKTLIILRIDAKIPMNKGTFDEGNSVQTALFRDNSAFLSPGLKFIQHLTTHLFLNLAAYVAPYAKLEGAQVSLNAGLAYDW